MREMFRAEGADSRAKPCLESSNEKEQREVFVSERGRGGWLLKKSTVQPLSRSIHFGTILTINPLNAKFILQFGGDGEALSCSLSLSISSTA